MNFQIITGGVRHPCVDGDGGLVSLEPKLRKELKKTNKRSQSGTGVPI